MARDLTEAQFQRALEQRGFRELEPIFRRYFVDTTGICPTLRIGGLYTDRPWRLWRRGTLAHLHQTRKEYPGREQRRLAKRHKEHCPA
jgi:hypothetical protein